MKNIIKNKKTLDLTHEAIKEWPHLVKSGDIIKTKNGYEEVTEIERETRYGYLNVNNNQYGIAMGRKVRIKTSETYKYFKLPNTITVFKKK